MIRHCPYHHRMLAAGATMVDRLGIAAPLHYSSTKDEHLATRGAVGVFDVYYQVAIEVSGADATSFLDRLAVNAIGRMTDGMSLYTSFCSQSGGMVDDLTVFRLKADRYWLFCTPARVESMMRHLDTYVGASTVWISNLGYKFAYLSVQGPRSRELLQKLTRTDVSSSSLRYFRFLFANVADVPETMISRTGYSGELGFELVYPSEYAEHMWDAVFSAGKDLGAVPCGLGALRTLRMEKKYPLYGLDIDETTSPVEAGLDWTVKLDKGEFLGRAVLEKQMHEGVSRRLSLLSFENLECDIKAGDLVRLEGTNTTAVRSAELGYSVGRALAQAYLPSSHIANGTRLTVVSSSGALYSATVTTKAPYDPDRRRALS